MKLLLGSVIAIASALAIPVSAWANTSPNGPGQPGAPNTVCQQFTQTPGSSGNSQSPFNQNGSTSANNYAGNPGTSSLANSNSSKAVSQYDIACFQQTSHSH